MTDDPLNISTRKSLISLVALFLPPVAVLAPHGLVVLFAITALFAALSTPIRRSALTSLKQPLGYILGFILIWMLCSTLWAPNLLESLKLWFSVSTIFIGGLLLIAAARHLSHEEARIASAALAVSGLLLIVLITVELSFDNVLVRVVRSFVNYQGSEVTANNVNGATTIAAVLAIPILAAVRAHSNKLCCYGVAVLMLAVLWFAPMEAASAALVAALLSFVLAIAWGRFLFTTLTCFFCIGIMIAPLLPSFFLASIAKSFDINTLPSPWLHRIYIWNFVADRIAEKPFFGWGFDSARAIPGNDEFFYEGAQALPLHPHNGALQLWLELGAIGVLLFIPLALLICIKLRQEQPAVIAMGAATIVSWAFFSLVSFGAWHNWWLVIPWIGTAMFILNVRLRRFNNELQ